MDMEKTQAETVDIAREQPLWCVAEVPADSRFHFTGGPVGKSDAQHLVELDAVHCVCMEYATCENMGLAAAGRCQHECTGAVELYKFPLAAVVKFHLCLRPLCVGHSLI